MTTAKTAAGTVVRRAAAGALLLAAPACTDWAGHDLDMAAGNIPQLSTMRESVRPDPYEYLRLPAPGSVPVHSPNGDVPAPYTALQLDSLGAALANPLAGRMDEATLARGRLMYERNCSVCHGTQGRGDGPVVQQRKDAEGRSHARFPYAPPVVGAAAESRSDGYLYGVIAVGRGLMPPYGERISHTDRWALVNYVRQLQGRGSSPAPAQPSAAGATAPAPANTLEELPAATRDSAPPLNAPAPAAQPRAGTR